MAQTAPQFDWESARPVDEEPQQPAAAPAAADDTYPGAPLAEKQTVAPLSPALFDWESARPVEAAQDFDMESAAPLKELAEDPSYLMSREQFRAHKKDAKETESAVADFLGGLPGVVPGLYSITTGTIGELGQQVAQNWYRPDKLLASLTANQNEGVRRMALSYAKMVDYVGQNLRDMDINRKREAAYGEQLRQKMQQEGKLTGDPIKDHEVVMQALFAAKDAGEIPLTDEQMAEDEERAYQDYWRGKNFDQAIGNITDINVAGRKATTPSMEWGARNIVTGEYVAPGKFSPDAVGMGIDPANILAAGIGSLARVNALRRAGILLGKGLGPTGEVLSKTGAAIGRGADAVTQRIQLATGGQRVGEKVIGGLSPEMQAYGGVTSAAAVGYMTGGDTPLDQAMTGALALLPTVRMVGGTLRKAGTAANAGWIITREMDAGAMSAARADAAKGLAANSAIPERYAKFIRGEGRASADSTLRRVAQDQANPRLLRSLSQFGDNVGLTSAVRATDDAIGGALVGASATVPFALAAPEPEQAGGIIGMGLMLGGAGGVVGGKLTRVAEMQDAMVARMLVDAQASGGNADAFSRLPHQDLVSLAGLQAFSRGKLTFKPLTTSEYRVNLDVTKRRGENSAGFYVETADDGTSTVFINMGEPSAVAGVVSKIRPVTKGGKTIEVRDKDGNSTFTYVPNESRIAVKQGDSVGVGTPLTRGTPSRLSVPEEIAHAIFSSKAMDGIPRDEMRNYINQRYKTEGVAARGREYAARIVDQDIAAGVYGAADSIDDATRDQLVEQRFTEFSQASIEDGADPLDWARDEIIAASLRASVQGIDLARLRNQSNFSRLAEQVVSSSAQALRVLGVDVDKMGRVLDPAGTFRYNPVFADPAMRRMVTKYMRDYDQWLAGMEDAGRKDRRGVRVAPSGKVEDYANSQHTVLREIKDANGNGTGVFENDVVTRGADGVVRPKKQSDIDRTEVSRAAQIKSLWDAGKTVPTASTEFGKRRVNGRDIVGGPTLPKQWDLFTQFPQWIREFARQLEAGRGDGRTWIADYNAIGTGSSGRYRVTNLGNIEAILREVAFVGWQVTKKNHLLATVFDMNAFRAAAKRAIDNGELGELSNNMDEVNATLLQYLDNHKNGRPGEYGIGQTKKNILNGLIGTGTAKQTAANPFYAELNPRGSVRAFRVDRLNDLRDTGRTGYNFMYEPINANMMPDSVRAPKDLTTDQILRELEENQGYLGLSTLGMREGRPVKGGAQRTRELLKRNTALNEELRRRGGPQEESDVARVLRQRGQAMPNVDTDYMAAVDAGDLEAAQRILDDAAVGSGKVVAWHADGNRPDKTEFTKGYKFRLERNGKSEILGFFAEKPHTSEPYGEPKKYYLQLSKTLDALIPQELNAGLMQHKTLDAWKRFFKSKGVDGEIKFDSAIQEDPYKGGSKVAGKPKKYFLYEVLDNNTGYWNGDGTIMQRLVESGFDSIVYSEQGDRSWIVFGEPSQIKSADVIAKDNTGSIVLPSQRFGPATGRTRGQAMPDVADIDTAKFTVAYRGGPSGKGDFPGTFVSTSQEAAAQYGDVRAVGVPRGLKVLSIDDDAALQLARQYEKRHPADALNDDLTAGESPTDLFMFPRPEWVKMLKQKGYQATQMGEDLFVFDGVKLKDSGQAMDNLDGDYMAAVQRGDLKSAQKIVDRAADNQPNKVKGVAYHYTSNEFTEFDNAAARKKSFDAWMQNSKAREEAMKQGKPIPKSVESEPGWTTSYGSDYVFPDNAHFFFLDNAPPETLPQTEGRRLIKAHLYSGKTLDLTKKISGKEFAPIAQWMQKEFSREASPGMAGYRVSGRFVDGLRRAKAEGVTPQQLFDFINNESFYDRKKVWRNLMDALGYDAIKFEANSSGTSLLEPRRGRADGKSYTVVAVLNGDQIKLADPVVRDGDGNIIPPSKRFDRTSRDIRYGIAVAALAAGAMASQEEQ